VSQQAVQFSAMKLVRSPRFWIGILISLLCLWLAFRKVPLAEFGAALAQANYLWLIPAVVAQFLAVFSRAQRWVVLLPGRGLVKETFWAHCIGFLFTNVLPFRMGEPARIIVLSSRTGIPVVQAAGTALVERILDLALIVILLVVVLPFVNVPPLVTQAGVTFGILVLAAVIGLVVVVRLRTLSERLLDWLLARLSFLPAAAIRARWGELVEGLAPLVRLRSGLSVILWTLISWFFSILIYYLVFLSFKPDARLIEAVFIVVALALAITIPSSPGFIGVFQYAGQQALVLPFGARYSQSEALAITMTAYLVYYIITTGLGVMALWKVGESFGSLWRLVTNRQPKTGKEELTSSGSEEIP